MLYRGSPLRLHYESNSGPTAGALQDLRSEGFLRLHARCRKNEDLPLCGDIFIIRKDHSSKAELSILNFLYGVQSSVMQKT